MLRVVDFVVPGLASVNTALPSLQPGDHAGRPAARLPAPPRRRQHAPVRPSRADKVAEALLRGRLAARRGRQLLASAQTRTGAPVR